MLDDLIESARAAQAQGLTMSAEQREAQKRSFAYGTSHIENEAITRALIDAEADRFSS